MDAAFFVASHTTPPGSASRLRHLIRPLSYIECAAMAIKHFKVGDHVSWNSGAGRVRGHITRSRDVTEIDVQRLHGSCQQG